MDNQEFLEPLQACAICGGVTTLREAGKASLMVGGKEARLYYHNTCFNQKGAKELLESKFKELLQSLPK